MAAASISVVEHDGVMRPFGAVATRLVPLTALRFCRARRGRIPTRPQLPRLIHLKASAGADAVSCSSKAARFAPPWTGESSDEGYRGTEPDTIDRERIQ